MRKFLSNKLYLSAVGVAVVFAINVVYLFAVVLDTPVTSRARNVVVEMPSTGGLFKGSAVTYRGIKVGKVTDMELTANSVEAHVKLTSSHKIPRNSLVKVRSLSPVGEQYLDFQPTGAQGPFLENGTRIPATATELPLTLASTVVSINKVLNQIDDSQLRTVLKELSTGLSGTGQDLGRLTDQTSALLNDLNAYWPQTARLIDNGATVLDIGTDNADSLQKLATTSKQFAAFLKNYDPELRATLNKAPGQINTLKALVADVQKTVPGFLKTGVSFTELLAVHDPQLRALLQNFEPGLSVLGKSVHNNSLQLLGYFQNDQRCPYGTSPRNPRDARRAMRLDARCSASFSTLQRGAAHAPGPIR